MCVNTFLSGDIYNFDIMDLPRNDYTRIILKCCYGVYPLCNIRDRLSESGLLS